VGGLVAFLLAGDMGACYAHLELHAGAERSAAPDVCDERGERVMPQPGMCWRLVTINTRNSWLHGDRRGFRSRGHRVHSSGDYRDPPPAGEHAGLRAYHRARAASPTRIPHDLKPVVGQALIADLVERGYRVLAVSVCSDHAHLVVELPDAPRQIRAVIGEAKRASSRAVKHQMPGSIWSAGCDPRPKTRRWALAGAIRYVRDRQGQGSWTWSFWDVEGAYR